MNRQLALCDKCKRPHLSRVYSTPGGQYVANVCDDCLDAQGKCSECGSILKRTCLSGTSNVIMICTNVKCAKAKEDMKTLNAHAINERIKIASKIIPEEFARPTDRSLLPDKIAFTKATAYTFPDGRGLLLQGPSGLAKTRALYSIVNKHILSGKTVKIFSGASFGSESSLAFSDPDGGLKWERRLYDVDLLAFDDLGKGRWNDLRSSVLFQIVKERTERHKPILVTTNDVYSTLLDKIEDENLLRPVWRRLNEFCETIIFKDRRK